MTNMNDDSDMNNVYNWAMGIGAVRTPTVPGRQDVEKQMETFLAVPKEVFDISQLRDTDDLEFYDDLDGSATYEYVQIEDHSRLLVPEPSRIRNDVPMQDTLLSVLGYVGVQSQAFEQVPKFFPFGRQHRDLYELGSFKKNDSDAVIVFPDVGFEWFTTQFKNNTAVLTPNDGIISMNSVVNIAYFCRAVPRGEEYVVFAVHHNNVVNYYLWDDEGIVVVESQGTSYGIRDGRTYTVLSGFSFERRGYTVVYPIVYYLHPTALPSSAILGYLINVNGVDYMMPIERVVCLQGANGVTTDVGKSMNYCVDEYVEGNAWYVVKKNEYRFQRRTHVRADSATAISIMERNVIVYREIVNYLKFTKGPLSVVTTPTLTMRVISSKDEIYKCDMAGEIPFFVRSHGMSKNAAVARYVLNHNKLYLNSAHMTGDKFESLYIGNNNYRRCYKPKLLLYRYRNKMDHNVLRVYPTQGPDQYDNSQCIALRQNHGKKRFVVLWRRAMDFNISVRWDVRDVMAKAIIAQNPTSIVVDEGVRHASAPPLTQIQAEQLELYAQKLAALNFYEKAKPGSVVGSVGRYTSFPRDMLLDDDDEYCGGSPRDAS